MKKRRQNAKVYPFLKKGKRKRGRGASFEQDGGDMSSSSFIMGQRRRKAKDRETREAKRRRKVHSKQDWKCIGEDSSVDRISMLPDELLGLILSNLIIKEQIATSILSCRWRYLWTLTTRLDFDGIDSLVRVVLNEDNGTSALEKEKLNYVSMVNHVLASGKGSTIEVFKVHFSLSKNDEGCIDEWLRYALARKVQTLELNLTRCSYRIKGDECYEFPIRFLHIDEGICSNSIHFKQLKKILLDYVQVDGEVLKFFLHNCPLLEDLSVSNSSELSTLRVTGPFPSLKRLEISSCRNLDLLEISDVNLVYLKYSGLRIYFILRNLPMLVNLSVTNLIFAHMVGTVMQFPDILQQLEILNLHEVVPTFYFPVKMKNLKQLVVTLLLGDFESPLWLTNLICSAPRLQKFVLEALRLVQRFPVRELQRMKLKKLYPRLKEVEFVGFCGVPSDLEFVFHFVDNAVALDKIVIDPKSPCSTPYEHKFLKNVLMNNKIIAIDRAKKQLVKEVPWKIKVDFLSPFY